MIEFDLKRSSGLLALSYVSFYSPELPEKGDVDWAIEVLDKVERAKANRFRSNRDRRRFVWRRYLRRHLLAEALSAEPGELVFALACPRCGSDAHGKPYLFDAPHLHFSAAQSDDHTAVAIGPAPFGIDIQTRSPELRDVDGFTPGEQAQLGERLHKAPCVLRDAPSGLLRMTRGIGCKSVVMRRSASEERVSKHAEDQRLTVLWARKEAYLKGLGLGLSIDPACVDARASGFADGVFGPVGAPSLASWSVASWTLPNAILAIACASPQAVQFAEIIAADPQTGRLTIKAAKTGGHEGETRMIYASSGASGAADLSRVR